MLFCDLFLPLLSSLCLSLSLSYSGITGLLPLPTPHRRASAPVRLPCVPVEQLLLEFSMQQLRQIDSEGRTLISGGLKILFFLCLTLFHSFQIFHLTVIAS